MNKRFIELAEQAGFVYNFDPVTWMKHEKFAELIVQECVSIVEDAVNHREPASTYVDKIREHFGIEE